MAESSELIADSLANLGFLQGPGMEAPSLRIMLLTSSLGSGHMMASRALEAALVEKYPAIDIETVDFWSLMDPAVAGAVCQAYLDTISKEPELYDDVYRLGQQTWRGLFDASQSLPTQLETFLDHFTARVSRSNSTAAGAMEGDPHPSDRVLLRYLHASLARRRRNGAAARALVRPVLSRWVWARLSRRLEQKVTDFGPHAAIATQMGPAALFAAIRHRRKLAVPLIAVPTDFGIHEFWLQRGVGCFCVAHESVWRPDLPAGSLVRATGLPLMPGFRNPPGREEARAQFRLHPDRPVVLVAGGGLGLGVGELSERIVTEVPGVTVVAVTGRNAVARSAVQALVPYSSDRLINCGWTDRMPALLRAADVVVGKPGGLTVAESLACGRYLLAINSPGGQESSNVQFLARHGAGELVRKEEVGGRLRALLADPDHLRALQAHVASLGRRDGATRIAALALDAAREGREALAGARA
jgi:processive 1,2-diacylglycerol beta-glucosyltransferase